jgi:hypothetical protein
MLGSSVDIRVDASMVERFQFRFPRSKRARIRKKWRKRSKNYATRPKQEAIGFIDPLTKRQVFVMHPAIKDALDREIDLRNAQCPPTASS